MSTPQVAVWPRGIQMVKTSGPLALSWDTETARTGKPVFAQDYGELVSVTASTRYEEGFGGHDLCSWTVTPHGGYIGGMFRPGDHVKITQGGGTVGEYELSEVLPQADGTVQFYGRGYAYNLFEYNSIEVVDGPTEGWSRPTTQLVENTPVVGWTKTFGWDYAIDVLGMPINQVVGAQHDWNAPLPGTVDKPYRVGEVITEKQRLHNERWAVWGRTLVLAPDPTTALWTYDAPDSVIGVADTDYYTHVGIWYVNDGPDLWSSSDVFAPGDLTSYQGREYRYLWPDSSKGNIEPGTDTTVWEDLGVSQDLRDTTIEWAPNDPYSGGLSGVNLFDYRDVLLDYRGRGRMSGAEASIEANSILEQVGGRFLLSGSFTIGPSSGFKSANGGVVEQIAFIRAGQGMTLTGLRTTQGNAMDGFHIIGRTEWAWEAGGEERMTIAPMGAVPRNFSEILRGAPLSGGGA